MIFFFSREFFYYRNFLSPRPSFTFLLILPSFTSVRYAWTAAAEVWILLKLADNCLRKAPSPVFTFFLINTKQLKQFQKLVILVNNNLGKYKAPKLLDYYRFVSF